MKALLYKDFVSSKSSLLLSLAIMLVIAIASIYQGMIFVIPFLFIYIPIILNATSFGNETQSNFPKFLFVTPITRKEYVKSKYMIAIIFSVLAFFSSSIIFYLEFNKLNLSLLIGIVTFAIPLLFSCIQVPFIIKFGEEKARIIFVITYFMIFGLSSYLSDKIVKIINFIQEINILNSYLVIGLVFVISIIALLISQNIGVEIVKRKEY